VPEAKPVEITLGLMGEAHLEQVVEIEQASYPQPWSRQSFADELKNGYACYLVALAENKVVGFGGMWLIFDEAQITNVAVSPTQRGKNIGKTLVLGLIAQATRSGCLKMTLEVRPSNLVAVHLYESLGFVAAGLRKKYYEDSGEDAIIMWR
jgi:ribosomal-protein-alanine N-acetyltransferase